MRLAQASNRRDRIPDTIRKGSAPLAITRPQHSPTSPTEGTGSPSGINARCFHELFRSNHQILGAQWVRLVITPTTLGISSGLPAISSETTSPSTHAHF